MKLIPEQVEGIKKQIAEKINVVSDVDYLEESREDFRKNISECGVREKFLKDICLKLMLILLD